MNLFVKYNPNPKNKKVDDCVVRAFCKALDSDWDTVYSDLCTIGADLRVMPNDKEAWHKYLEINNFIKHTIRPLRGTTRPTVETFAKNNPTGTYVLRVANHLVSVQDGQYFDTWDCGKKSLYGYWEKP